MMKRRIFKIIIDSDVESIIEIYVFATLKTFFMLSTLILSTIQLILLISKLNTMTSNIGISIGIIITSLLTLIMNLIHSKMRNKFLEKLDNGGEDKNINKPIIKKDKYRCP